MDINFKKLGIIFILYFFQICILFAQQGEVYVCDKLGRLIKIDIENGAYKVLKTIGNFGDIAFHPDGNIYAIDQFGELFAIDTVDYNAEKIASLPGNFFTSLTCDTEGNIYAATSDGILVSYKPELKSLIEFPNIGIGAAGDLTFYENKLYMSTIDNTLLFVNPEEPLDNYQVLDFSSHQVEIFGIFSAVKGCEIKSYAFSSEDNSTLYEIDWEGKSIRKLFSFSDLNIYGATSRYEFKASKALYKINEISISNKSCSSFDYNVEIESEGLGSDLMMSLDGINFKSTPGFSKIDTGLHIVYFIDEFNCRGKDTFELLMPELRVEIIQTENSTCGQLNGTIKLEILSNSENYSVFVNGISIDNNTLNNLAPNQYNIEVSDSFGCTFETSICIEEEKVISIVSSNITNANCGENNGAIELDVNIPILYSEINDFKSDKINWEGLSPGDYYIKLTDLNNCTTTSAFTILDEDNCGMFIPNIFSPNQDGYNDDFKIFSKEKRDIDEIIVLDRWGNIVYRDANFTIDQNSYYQLSWNTLGLKSGIYAYLLKITGIDRMVMLSGDITLIK